MPWLSRMRTNEDRQTWQRSVLGAPGAARTPYASAGWDRSPGWCAQAVKTQPGAQVSAVDLGAGNLMLLPGVMRSVRVLTARWQCDTVDASAGRQRPVDRFPAAAVAGNQPQREVNVAAVRGAPSG